VAARLSGATRSRDTVARLGGDEFAVLLEDVDADGDVRAAAERITGAMAPPLLLDGREVRVGTSVGIARGAAGAGADELLRNADVALYRAKAAGKGTHALFSPEMHEAIMERLELETELRHALDRREFAVAYQPIVELRSGEVTGAEALVRWHHPRLGLVNPGAFVRLAEETGMIVPLGRWILAEACRQAVRWSALAGAGRGGAPVEVAVNVSGRQLTHPEFLGDVAAALGESGLPPAALVLEMTESVLIDDSEATLGPLRALKALGVRLAVDDFGTGYSSLAYLHRFPIDVIKLDKAFVAGIARGGRDAALARAVLSLGDALGLQTVAEGVETAEQRAHLRELGCRLAQGYLFARPTDAAGLDAAFARRSHPDTGFP
jgi:predicted signal transduction protein with EAL and GGDEF domain